MEDGQKTKCVRIYNLSTRPEFIKLAPILFIYLVAVIGQHIIFPWNTGLEIELVTPNVKSRMR